jgi:peroxiredoxin
MQATGLPEIGAQAPEFRLKGPGGQVVELSEFRGRKHVVLVFYPLAFSGVCSHQLPIVEKDAGKFRELDAELFGVSVDSHYANTEFAHKLKLSFPLLSDFRREASTAYGVLLDTGYSARAIFVIDRGGVLIHREISANAGDVEQIPSNVRALDALKALRQAP